MCIDFYNNQHNLNLTMKSIKSLMAFAITLLGTIFVSCGEKEPAPEPSTTPAVAITKVSVDSTSVTVNVQPTNAEECYVHYIIKGETELDDVTILAEGTQLSATEATEHKIEGLDAQTTYIIYAAVRASNQTAVSSVEVTTAEQAAPVAEFGITCEIVMNNANISIVPKDATKPYFFYIMEKSVFDETYNGDAAAAAQADINKIISEYLDFVGGAPADALAEMLDIGESQDSFPVNGNRQYICYACYTDPQDGTVLGDVETYEFAGPEIAPSANTFTIEVLSSTFCSIEYGITPSNDDQYSYSLISKEEFEQQSVEEYIANMMWMYGIFMPATTGYYSSQNEYLTPDTEYALIVFGYEAGVCTTTPTVQYMRTAPQGDASQCTFTIDLEAANRYTLSYNITPSDNSVIYYYDICLGNQTAADVTSALDAAIEEAIAAEWFSSRAEYFNIWAKYGVVSESTTVAPNNEGFKIYAVAIDTATGEYGGDVYFSNVCYMPEFVASDIVVKCNIDQYFDGADLAQAIPMFYAGWGEDYVFFTPKFSFENGEPVTFYYQVYQYNPAYEDQDTYNEDWAIPALLNNGYPFPDYELYMPWGYTGYLMCVALDSNGNFSSVYRQKLEFDRSASTPATEHPYYGMEVPYSASKKAVAKNSKGTKLPVMQTQLPSLM